MFTTCTTQSTVPTQQPSSSPAKSPALPKTKMPPTLGVNETNSWQPMLRVDFVMDDLSHLSRIGKRNHQDEFDAFKDIGPPLHNLWLYRLAV